MLRELKEAKQSLVAIWGKISETVISVPTGNLLGLRTADLSVLRMKRVRYKKRGSFGKALGTCYIHTPNVCTALIGKTRTLDYMFANLSRGF